MPAGWYVIVKRFSSKEEKRRIVSYIVDPGELPGTLIGFENHWNVFHVRKKGLDPIVARGLAVFLNSTVVDDHFRVFSGHTQVNATDLRNMKYPTIGELRELGKLAGHGRLTQVAIDALIEKLETRKQ
jgi:adenine-specific DNA-methyltransferase